jgi:hypothetical protein
MQRTLNSQLPVDGDYNNQISRRFFTFFLSAIFVFNLASHSLAQQQNLYSNKPHAFRIIFPEGWSIKSGSGPNVVVKAANHSGESINIVVKDLPKDSQKKTFDNFSSTEIENFIDASFKMWKEAFPDAFLDKSGTIYVSNKKAVWLLISCSYKNVKEEKRMRLLQVAILNRGKSFLITCGSPIDRFAYFEGIFSKTISNFVFEDPSWY